LMRRIGAPLEIGSSKGNTKNENCKYAEGPGSRGPRGSSHAQGTRRPIAEGRDGPRQACVITSTVTTKISAHRGRAGIPSQSRLLSLTRTFPSQSKPFTLFNRPMLGIGSRQTRFRRDSHADPISGRRDR
jgi:hypothetical protein